jgi:hypothetical protein
MEYVIRSDYPSFYSKQIVKVLYLGKCHTQNIYKEKIKTTQLAESTNLSPPTRPEQRDHITLVRDCC